MAERDIVTAILRLLRKTPNCFCWKEHGGMYGTAGIPDVIACINGRFVAFEVKTETGHAIMAVVKKGSRKRSQRNLRALLLWRRLCQENQSIPAAIPAARS